MIAICRDPDDLLFITRDNGLSAIADAGYKLVLTDLAIDAYGDTCDVFADLHSNNCFSIATLTSEELAELMVEFEENCSDTELLPHDYSVISHALRTGGAVITQDPYMVNACLVFNVKVFTTNSFVRSLLLTKKQTTSKSRSDPT